MRIAHTSKIGDLFIPALEERAELLHHRLAKSRESADKSLRIPLSSIVVAIGTIVGAIGLTGTASTARLRARRIIIGLGRAILCQDSCEQPGCLVESLIASACWDSTLANCARPQRRRPAHSR